MGWHSNPCANLSDTRSYQAAGNSIDLHVLRPLLEGCAERVQTLRAQHRRRIYESASVSEFQLGDVSDIPWPSVSEFRREWEEAERLYVNNASDIPVPMSSVELMSTDEEEDDPRNGQLCP